MEHYKACLMGFSKSIGCQAELTIGHHELLLMFGCDGNAMQMTARKTQPFGWKSILRKIIFCHPKCRPVITSTDDAVRFVNTKFHENATVLDRSHVLQWLVNSSCAVWIFILVLYPKNPSPKTICPCLFISEYMNLLRILMNEALWCMIHKPRKANSNLHFKCYISFGDGECVLARVYLTDLNE